MEKKNSVDKIILSAAFIFLLICMSIFFISAHPMYIYDTDDWTYISANRVGVPIPGGWNPIKVLPETLFPLICELSVNVIYPFTGDYFGAMALGVGLFTAILITVFLYLFSSVIRMKCGLSYKKQVVCMFFLALIMFLPYATGETAWGHMFYASTVNGYFNYIVPAVFNAILALAIWKNEDKRAEKQFGTENIVFASLTCLLIYLCIFSNIFHSVISMSIVGAILTERLISSIVLNRNKGSEKKKFYRLLKEYIFDNISYLAMLFVWFVSLILEANGQRASSNDGIHDSIAKTFGYLIKRFASLNKMFWLLLFVTVSAAVIMNILFFAKKKDEETDKNYRKNVIRYIFTLLLTTVFLILVCTRVSAEYIANTGVFWGIMFWIIMLMMVSAGYILKRCEYTILAMPVVILVLVSVIVVGKNNYMDIYSPEKIKLINEDMVSQIVEADQRGEGSVEVLIPKHQNPEWPLNIYYGGERISKSLYRHEITQKQMNITLVPSEEKSIEFGYPEE